MLSGFLVLSTMFNTLQQAPGPAHYRIAFNATRQVERGRAGDTPQGGTYAAVAYVTVTTKTGPAGRTGHVVIDSVTSDGVGLTAMAYDPIVGRAAVGATYDVEISSRLEGVPTASISNPVTGSLGQAVALLFPTPKTLPAKGATWADTLDATPSPEAMIPDSPLITHWKVTNATADSITVEGDLAGTISTTGRVLATSVVSGRRRMTVVGGLLKSASLSMSQQMLVLPAGGSDITTVRGQTNVEVTRIK